jgi:hypothetical protein
MAATGMIHSVDKPLGFGVFVMVVAVVAAEAGAEAAALAEADLADGAGDEAAFRARFGLETLGVTLPAAIVYTLPAVLLCAVVCPALRA